MLMGQSHFVQKDLEPSRRLRLFLGRKRAVWFQGVEAARRLSLGGRMLVQSTRGFVAHPS